jgi:hypothetical protein
MLGLIPSILSLRLLRRNAPDANSGSVFGRSDELNSGRFEGFLDFDQSGGAARRYSIKLLEAQKGTQTNA